MPNRPTPNLRSIAVDAMLTRGFLVQFPSNALEQLKTEPNPVAASTAKDLTAWFWSSIDNDESRDLDQVEYAQRETGGTRIYVGIADVDYYVSKDSPLDQAAEHNTTSVYTGVLTFPMLPEVLSTDRSSLNDHEKRMAIVAEMLVSDDGAISDSSVYSAILENKAQLTYEGVAAWLDGTANNHTSDATRRTLAKINASKDLQEQITLQDKTAELLRNRRHEAGALSFHTAELQPVLSSDGNVVDLRSRQQNRASFLIEDFMIAANQTTAAFLDQHHLPSIQRIVREPERWDRIVELAASLGGHLSPEPDAISLEAFLMEQQRANPAHFAELSLSIIKLLGRGEYVVKLPGGNPTGHFGLAVANYSHSTAPNRRYPDLITQRLLKAAFAEKASPYSGDELETLAKHCTEMENEASKVERFVKKAAAATILISQIGKTFEAVVTGASAKGTWVRLLHPPVEGKLMTSGRFDVGQRLRVRLVYANPEKALIDFEVS